MRKLILAALTVGSISVAPAEARWRGGWHGGWGGPGLAFGLAAGALAFGAAAAASPCFRRDLRHRLPAEPGGDR